MHWLAGRLALVTGASRGIGAATAEAIAAAGATVVLAARDGEALGGWPSGSARPAARRRREHRRLQDVEVQRLFDAAEGDHSRRWCARPGCWSPRRSPSTTRIWDETLPPNLTGTFLCCRVAFTAMRDAGEGRIVNIASLSGVYATEKFPGPPPTTSPSTASSGSPRRSRWRAGSWRQRDLREPGAVDTEMLRARTPSCGRGSPRPTWPS